MRRPSAAAAAIATLVFTFICMQLLADRLLLYAYPTGYQFFVINGIIYLVTSMSAVVVMLLLWQLPPRPTQVDEEAKSIAATIDVLECIESGGMSRSLLLDPRADIAAEIKKLQIQLKGRRRR